MDDERFAILYRCVSAFAWPRRKRLQYSDAFLAALLLWSVLRRKPRSWACDPRNAPRVLAHCPLPSPACFSRRLRDPQFIAFWQQLLQHLIELENNALCLLACYLIDAKPLPVNRYSKDKQAKFGWAINGLAKGYKLFLLADTRGCIVAYQVHAMNTAEQTVALDLIQATDRPGYALADSVYDTQAFYDAAAARQVQLIAPRKQPGGNVAERAANSARLRGISMLETPLPRLFGPTLYEQRTQIERIFSRLGSSQVGLDSLPPWVRTLARVRLWIDAMILIYVVTAAGK